jgi:hypothetical protein
MINNWKDNMSTHLSNYSCIAAMKPVIQNALSTPVTDCRVYITSVKFHRANEKLLKLHDVSFQEVLCNFDFVTNHLQYVKHLVTN